jgi:lipopolysaccharide transport system permease protein
MEPAALHDPAAATPVPPAEGAGGKGARDNNAEGKPFALLNPALPPVSVTQGALGSRNFYTLGSDHAVWTRTLSPGGTLGAWSSLGGQCRALAVGTNADGGDQIYAIGLEGGVWTSAEGVPGQWSGWTGLGGDCRQLTIARNAAGYHDVYALALDDVLWKREQTGLLTFGPWVRLGPLSGDEAAGAPGPLPWSSSPATAAKSPESGEARNGDAHAAPHQAEEPAAVPATPPDVVIHSRRGWHPLDFRELWRYRELLWLFATRDLKVRYKQTVLGVAWVVFQPLSFTLVFAGFFALLGVKPSGNVPFVVNTFAALSLWQLFATTLGLCSDSLVANQGLIQKVYFCRLVFPLSPALVALADFGCNFLVLLGLMAFYGIYPGPAALLAPIFVALASLVAIAFGLWLSALGALYRDVRHTIPFLTTLWFYASPVFYNSGDVLGDNWQHVYFLNPMAGIIEGFRWSMLGRESSFAASSFAVSLAAAFAVLVGGLYFFRRMERTFSDWV